MIIHKVIFLILLCTRSESAEKVYDPCSEFVNPWSLNPVVKCPSEKSEQDYLECYDLSEKNLLEHNHAPLLHWCWSRKDNNEDVLKNLTISGYNDDNAEFNDMINKPFTANFHINETHIVCQDNEEWWTTIPDLVHANQIYCPTSTGIPVASFFYEKQRKL